MAGEALAEVRDDDLALKYSYGVGCMKEGEGYRMVYISLELRNVNGTLNSKIDAS
jgi:hypothetical protein